jgi:hypothetical protein
MATNHLGYSYKNMFYIWLLCCITAENVNSFGRIFSWGNSSNLFLSHEIGIFHLVKFLLSTKFWKNFARWNFSSQLVLMKLTPEFKLFPSDQISNEEWQQPKTNKISVACTIKLFTDVIAAIS